MFLSLKSSLSPISRLQLKLFVELLSLAIGVAVLYHFFETRKVYKNRKSSSRNKWIYGFFIASFTSLGLGLFKIIFTFFRNMCEIKG